MRLERGIDVRKVIDVGMMILLLLLMAFPFTGQDIHIFLGIIMIAFFIIHHYLNRRWYLSLFKGKKTKIQILFITINSLLLISIFGVALSGLTLAGYVPIMFFSKKDTFSMFLLELFTYGIACRFTSTSYKED